MPRDEDRRSITRKENGARYTVTYPIGSLSKESINRRLANAFVALAPQALIMQEVSIGDLPLYNRDFDGDYPEVAILFKRSIAISDAILFVTPELA